MQLSKAIVHVKKDLNASWVSNFESQDKRFKCKFSLVSDFTPWEKKIQMQIELVISHSTFHQRMYSYYHV